MIVNQQGMRVEPRSRSPWPEFDVLCREHGLSDLDVVLLACKAVGVSHSRIARAFKKHKGTVSRQVRDAQRRARLKV